MCSSDLRYQKMRVGYMRLQALIRSRVLAHRFKHLRGHVVGLQVRGKRSPLISFLPLPFLPFVFQIYCLIQARCRGYLVRRQARRRAWAATLIQSHVRRIIAQRMFMKMKVNVFQYFVVWPLIALNENLYLPSV